MSSAGHVLDMINRFNNNRKLLVERHYKYNKVKEAYLRANRKHTPIYEKDNIDDAKLKEIKQRIKTNIIKDRRRRVILTLITAPIITIFAGFIIFKVIVQVLGML